MSQLLQIGNNPFASINSLIEFTDASSTRRRAIVNAQKNPQICVVAHYRTARAALKRFIKNGFDHKQIEQAIAVLQTRSRNPQSSDWSKSDSKNSITAIRKFIELHFDRKWGKIHCSFPKVEQSKCWYEGILITISPDLIMRWEVDGKKYIGAVKFRISQKKWSPSAGINAASLLSYYLQHHVAANDEIVDNSHCFFIDVMDDSIYNAPSNTTIPLKKLSLACADYSDLWNLNVA